jgi:hypothetical protein
VTPAAIHRGSQLRLLAPGVWVEPVGRAVILHTEDDSLIARIGAELGRPAIPSLGPNGIFTAYVTARHADRAVELARLWAISHTQPANDA